MQPSDPRPRVDARKPRRANVRRVSVAGIAGLALFVTPLVTTPAHAATTITVGDGETYTVSSKQVIDRLVVAEGGEVKAADGYDVTLTVDGVEKGQVYDSWYGVTSSVRPGTYSGTVVLTPTVRHTATIGGVTIPTRQGLYVGNGAVDNDRSVDASWLGGTGPGDSSVDGLEIKSEGDGFDGVWVQDSTYDLTNPKISLTGNGRSDFVGAGAGIVGKGSGTKLTVDGATIDNTGAVRAGVVADGSANVVVKNSTIATHDGTLPTGYVSSVALGYMMDAPWMLGINGNVRATNLLGANTKAAYVNSDLYSEGWGVLSVDTGSYTKMSVINSKVETGKSGYGTYAIGNSNQQLLGTSFDVDDYGTIVTGSGSGLVRYGDSDASTVETLNTERELGLSEAELAKIEQRSTTVDSDRIGVMWHGAGNVVVDGGTTFNTVGTVFQDKSRSATATISVDGSDGATLNSDEGVIVQTMELDDPGPVSTSTDAGTILANRGTYTEPTTDVDRNTSWDLTSTTATARTAVDLTDMKVTGDFYNGTRTAKNLVLNLTDSTVRGVISSSKTKHQNGVTTITADNWYDIGQVDNTVASPINNGVIVDLAGTSTWRVTGTSYLTKLVVGDDARIVGAGGKPVTLTVDGVETAITPGTTYTGGYDNPIVVTVADGDIATTTSVTVDDTTYGQAGAAELSVVDADGDPAKGEVTVSVDGTEVGSATLAQGKATVALPSGIDAGHHSVVATYTGADGFSGSTSQTGYTVEQAASTTDLSLSASSITAGTAAQATVTVGYGSDDPVDGEATLLIDGSAAGTVTLTNGTGSVGLPTDLAVGDHTVQATYAGDANVAGSESGSRTLTVTEAAAVASKTAVSLSPATVAYGKTRTARVTVTASGTVPTGTVTVKVGGSTVGSGTLKSGTATISLPKSTRVGTHRVVATYNGTGQVAGSSGSATLKVTKATSKSRLRLSSTKVTVGKRVKARIRVSASGATPTGKVRVYSGSKLLTTVTLKAGHDGSVTKRLPKFKKAGTYRLRLVYGGSSTVASSKSSTVTLKVKKKG